MGGFRLCALLPRSGLRAGLRQQGRGFDFCFPSPHGLGSVITHLRDFAKSGLSMPVLWTGGQGACGSQVWDLIFGFSQR